MVKKTIKFAVHLCGKDAEEYVECYSLILIQDHLEGQELQSICQYRTNGSKSEKFFLSFLGFGLENL